MQPMLDTEWPPLCTKVKGPGAEVFVGKYAGRGVRRGTN